jgi:hypothetical protein
MLGLSFFICVAALLPNFPSNFSILTLSSFLVLHGQYLPIVFAALLLLVYRRQLVTAPNYLYLMALINLPYHFPFSFNCFNRFYLFER